MNKDKKLPGLRRDLTFKEYTENSEKFIIIFDPKGYAQQPVSIPVSILPLFNLIDGLKTHEEFYCEVRMFIGEDTDFVLEHFYNLVDFLDYNGFMDSENFRVIKSDIDLYLNSDKRDPICTDNSYPSDPLQLSLYLDEIFSSVNPADILSGAKSILVPHIDFRIGVEAHKCYSSGYHAIRESNADLFVILGTSHHGNSDYFMLTHKDFATPLGIVETDREILDELNLRISDGITIDDMAHRYEHSIEFQVVLLQHYFKNRKFRILPVLIGSFHNFIAGGTTPDSDSKFRIFIEQLNETIKILGRNAVFIASADMAHIGRKFGDSFDAENEFPRLISDDKQLLFQLETCNANGFFSLISDANDKNKICGLSPAYTLLKTTEPEKAKILGYGIWNETEAKSAVSFSCLAYY